MGRGLGNDDSQPILGSKERIKSWSFRLLQSHPGPQTGNYTQQTPYGAFYIRGATRMTLFTARYFWISIQYGNVDTRSPRQRSKVLYPEKGRQLSSLIHACCALQISSVSELSRVISTQKVRFKFSVTTASKY